MHNFAPNKILRNPSPSVHQVNLEYQKKYLCPKCNHSYNVFARNNTLTGKVPLILTCNHTLCEECVVSSIDNKRLTCIECNNVSFIHTEDKYDKRNIQEIFPVNFYILGFMYYCKPNLKQSAVLKLKPAGVKYTDYAQSNISLQNSMLCSDVNEFQKFDNQDKCCQENCKQSANVHCMDCDELYCNVCCETIHKSARGLKTHKIASINDFTPKLTTKCSVHINFYLEVFCNTCNQICCCYCIIQDHKTHDYHKLTDLNVLGDFDTTDLVLKAEAKLKRLLMAFKKAEEAKRTNDSCQTNQLDAAIGKVFSDGHAKLQLFEDKLRDEVKKVKYENTETLSNILHTLSLNIRKINALLNSLKNVKNPNANNKFDIRAVIEGLENALNFPCYLMGELQNFNDTQFVCPDFLGNLDDYFSIKYTSTKNNFRLVTENELPDNYNTTTTSVSPDLSVIMNNFSSTKSLSTSQLSLPSNFSSSTDVLSKSNQIEKWIKSGQNFSLAKDDRENVIVSHIDSPECFYVQLSRFESALQHLDLEIQRHSKIYFSPVQNVELNKLYIVKYNENEFDMKWYRGRVIKINPQQHGKTLYTIFFIDYGNTSIVTSDSIINISNDLLHHKPYAHKCKLFQTYPAGSSWNSKATLHMAKVLSESNVVMVIMANSNEILEIDLLAISSVQTTSMRDALIFVGLASPHIDSSLSSKNIKSKSYTKLHTRSEKLKNGDSLMVLICHVVNPHSIYIQIADFAHHLERLTNSMANYYNKKSEQHREQRRNEHIYVPKQGMVVAVQFESIWCRASITNIIKGEGTITAFLEDYGKSITMDYTKIRKLPDRFKTLECQAIHVKLADIKPSSEAWEKNSIEFLTEFVETKKVLRLVVINSVKIPEVALYECYETMDVCINTSIVDEGFAISTGDISKSLQHSVPSTEVQSSVNEKPYVFNLMNTIQSTISNEDNSSDSEQENVFRKPVKVLLVKNPNELYVEIEDSVVQKMQDELHQSLQDYYRSHKSKPICWEINDPCVAYNSLNSQYFRGIILEKTANHFKVMLRDVAQEIFVSEDNMFNLENRFKQFREKAVRCHLAHIIPAGDKHKWSGLAIDFLQKIFEKHTIFFMTKSGPLDHDRKSVPVIMWYLETKHEGALEPSKNVLCNINKLLVKNGLAFKTEEGFNQSLEQSNPSKVHNDVEVQSTLCKKSDVTSENSSKINNPSYTSSTLTSNDNAALQTMNFHRLPTHDKSFLPNNVQIIDMNNESDKNENYSCPDNESNDWLPPIPFKSTNFMAIATFVDNNACIYIHEKTKESVLKIMENEMKNYFINTSPEPLGTIWTPGQLCTVKYFVNDNWYRGRILCVEEECISVFLIDYGNDEECKHEDLRLKVMYLDLPAFANKIQLSQVYSKSGKWLTSDLDELHKKVVENEIFVDIKKKVEPGLAYPAIVTLNGLSINQYMRDFSTNLSYSSKTKNIDNANTSDDDVIIEDEQSDYVVESKLNIIDENYIQKSLSVDLIGQTINVTIISVINYDQFVLEILITEDVTKTKNLFKEISSDICTKSAEQPLLKDIKVGKPCIAKFSEDGIWYRGEIIDIKNLHIGMVQVWFVDYGNCEDISVEYIKELHPKWLELPILMYKAKIDGIILADPSCLNLVLNCMEDYCNTLQLAEIVSVNPLCVKLYDDQNHLIYQDLIDQQLLISLN